VLADPNWDLFRGKRNYTPVDLEKRKILVKIVDEEGITIKEAAQRLNLNYSTAKHIVKTFKKTGKIETQ
jgi:transposase